MIKQPPSSCCGFNVKRGNDQGWHNQSESTFSESTFNFFQSADSAVLQLDLSDLHSMTSKAAEAASIFGCIDILINNAGISYRGCIEKTSLDVDQSLMTVNYFGQVALTKGMIIFLLFHFI